MTLANDAVFVTPGSGASLAVHRVASGLTGHHQTVFAQAGGQAVETVPTVVLNLPPVDTGANRYHFELFNGAGSGVTLKLRTIQPVAPSDAANAFGVAQRMDFFRTTAPASGGTVFKTESASTVSAQFARLDTSDTALPSGVTCVTRPTSITTGSWLFPLYLSITMNSANQILGTVLGSMIQAPQSRKDFWAKPLTLRPGQGLAVRQGTVASTWSLQWLLEFTVE